MLGQRGPAKGGLHAERPSSGPGQAADVALAPRRKQRGPRKWSCRSSSRRASATARLPPRSGRLLVLHVELFERSQEQCAILPQFAFSSGRLDLWDRPPQPAPRGRTAMHSREAKPVRPEFLPASACESRDSTRSTKPIPSSRTTRYGFFQPLISLRLGYFVGSGMGIDSSPVVLGAADGLMPAPGLRRLGATNKANAYGTMQTTPRTAVFDTLRTTFSPPAIIAAWRACGGVPFRVRPAFPSADGTTRCRSGTGAKRHRP